jgi:hypothetical protein
MEEKVIAPVTSIVTLNPRNFHQWIAQVKQIAEEEGVWDYIDPAGDLEKPKLENPPRASNYEVKVKEGTNGAEITRKAKSAAELSKEQNEQFRSEMMDFNASDKINERIRAGLKTVGSAIRTSAQQHIPANEMSTTLRNILQKLEEKYKRNKTAIISSIHDQYQALKTPPAKSKIEKWISD